MVSLIRADPCRASRKSAWLSSRISGAYMLGHLHGLTNILTITGVGVNAGEQRQQRSRGQLLDRMRILCDSCSSAALR